MNRKRIALMTVAGIILSQSATGLMWAQPSRTQRPLALYVDLAYINLGEPPRWMAIGPELEWRIGRVFTLNPEVMLWFPDTLRGTIELIPGLTGNLRFNRIFVGGGVVGGVSGWTADTDGWFIPRVQMGYLSGPVKLTVSLYVPGGQNDVAFGLTIGTRIGRRRGPD